MISIKRKTAIFYSQFTSGSYHMYSSHVQKHVKTYTFGGPITLSQNNSSRSRRHRFFSFCSLPENLSPIRSRKDFFAILIPAHLLHLFSLILLRDLKLMSSFLFILHIINYIMMIIMRKRKRKNQRKGRK